MPLISSGHDLAGAETARRAVFARLEPTAASYERAHRSHRPEKGAYSICMHREDARTVSFSHVTSKRNGVAFAYVAGPPCRGRRAEVLELARTVARAAS